MASDKIQVRGTAADIPPIMGRPGVPSIDDAICVIRAYVRWRGWSMGRVAREARLNDTTLRDLHRPNWNPTATVMRTLYSIIPPDFDPATAPPPPQPTEE